jgi:cytolysin-activating lysine-acyltransferase
MLGQDSKSTRDVMAPGNGENSPAATGATVAPERPRDARQTRIAQAFSQVVAVLMRDPTFRQMRLADLEWLVLPPVMAGQFRLAQVPAPPSRGGAQQSGTLIPVAVALWARVSDAIDQSLSGNLDKAARLHVADWASGDNVWLMAVAGDRRAVPKFMARLAETEFKGRRVKMRVRGSDGRVVVKTLGDDKEFSEQKVTSKG